MAKKIKVKGFGAVKDVNPGDVWEAVKAHGYRGCDNPKADNNYIIIQNIAKRERLLIDCYHPSNMYQQFNNDKPKFKEQLEIALKLR